MSRRANVKSRRQKWEKITRLMKNKRKSAHRRRETDLAILHADLANLRADPVFNAFMDENCRILARAIAEDMVKEKGGAVGYWAAWIEQNIKAGRIMFDFKFEKGKPHGGESYTDGEMTMSYRYNRQELGSDEGKGMRAVPLLRPDRAR